MKRSAVVIPLVAIIGGGIGFVAGSTTKAHQLAGHSLHADGGINHSDTSSGSSPSSIAFAEANVRMHRDMNIAFSDNADVDFVRGMIPHHQGAVEMAEIVLQYGENPELRELAEAIVTTQEEEIGFMVGWLEENDSAE